MTGMSAHSVILACMQTRAWGFGNKLWAQVHWAVVSHSSMIKAETASKILHCDYTFMADHPRRFY
jgi:hypothetical protein